MAQSADSRVQVLQDHFVQGPLRLTGVSLKAKGRKCYASNLKRSDPQVCQRRTLLKPAAVTDNQTAYFLCVFW